MFPQGAKTKKTICIFVVLVLQAGIFLTGSRISADDIQLIRPDIAQLRILAEQGDREAMFALSQVLEYGAVSQGGKDGIHARDEALYWLKQAAEHDSGAALLYLGIKYEFGAGVVQDYSLAARYYRLAAKKGFVQAYYYLAGLYENGRGVEQDLFTSFCLYFLAEEEFYPNAGEQKALVIDKMTSALLVSSLNTSVDPSSVILPRCRVKSP